MTKVKNTEKKGFKIDMQKALAPAALVILYILFAIVGNNFFTWDTAENILQSAYYIGFMAFGVTFIIITGGIDLSLGTVMMCSALIGAYAFNAWGLPLGVGVVITLAIAMTFGLLNGIMIAKLGLPPFIATLGSQMVSMGIGSIITKVQAQTWPAASAEVGGWFKKALVRTKVFDAIPIGAIWLIVFFVISYFCGALMNLGFGYYAPCMGTVLAMGMSGACAFPIMMGSCAFLMNVSVFKFVKEGKYDRRATLMLMFPGALGAFAAYKIACWFSLTTLTYVVCVVMLITATMYINDAKKMA